MSSTNFTSKETRAMWVFSGTLCTIVLLTVITTLVKQYNRKNIAGQWKMTFIHEHRAYNSDINQMQTHEIYFTQNDEAVTGDGKNNKGSDKERENAMLYKMEYKGIVDNDMLKATYKLSGNEKEATGVIEATITDDGKNLMGTFSGSSDAGKGTVMGEKIR